MSAATGAKPAKPLGGKAYGSIPHLPGSKLGPGDHHVHPGQAAIALVKPRKGDRVIVTEKLDGSCMAIANIGGEIVALGRAGYRARDGVFEHQLLFEAYVQANIPRFIELLKPGERLCGEWLAMAHGTRYDPSHEGFAPFVAFDIIREGTRVLADEFRARGGAAGIRMACVFSDGPTSYGIGDAMATLFGRGFHGALDEVEGAVWRVEREGHVDFLAKYVRPDKAIGCYLPELSGAPPIWHWRPEEHAA